MSSESNLPSTSEKPSLLDWLETFLPFRLPRIPLLNTAKNLDKAAAAIVLATSENAAARIQASTAIVAARTEAKKALVSYGQALIEGKPIDLADRALEYALGDALKRQQNRETILSITADDLRTDPPREDAPQAIDDDWLDAFKRYAETKSNVDIQQLWARILSSEIRKPGSTSLRTLAFLSTISSADANFIVSAFSYVIDEEFIPAWAKETERLSYRQLLSLHELGIITEINGIGGPQITKKSVQQNFFGHLTHIVYFEYYGRAYVFHKVTGEFSIDVPVNPLSQLGRELFQLTDARVPDHNTIEAFAAAIKPADLSQLAVCEIKSRVDGQFRLGVPRILFGNAS